MSALFSETLSDAFQQVRLSYDRIVIRLSRCAMSVMNLAVRLLQLFCVTLLYFSAVKSAYIPKENGGSTNEVVPFTDVYNKSMCRPREMLVEVHQEYPDDIEHIFIPSCVVLMRCAGCCNDEMLECKPTATRNITMESKESTAGKDREKTPERQGERSKGKAKEKPRQNAGFVCYLSLLLHPPAPECYALGHQINLGGDLLPPLINQNHN
ncbi:vascular endothelial growth factor Ab isoform X3 [Hemibagrus wyckioides]|uniref:vascular endothelial growth factor Ab isoform X3 n=1 Tax=Hemibagrus wyckioides TaxID=337641 RepID=UPI00266BD649|nr:vascular endothelial growth factor Ab isoform X3 [Hemibagrus wyckioides]